MARVFEMGVDDLYVSSFRLFGCSEIVFKDDKEVIFVSKDSTKVYQVYVVSKERLSNKLILLSRRLVVRV